MTLRTKIVSAFVFVVLALILIPYWVTTRTGNGQPNAPQDDLKEPPVTAPVDFDTSVFELEENFVFEKPESWELASHDPDRTVDRYRFERPTEPSAVFTVSFYDQYSSFEEVIDARYGTGFVSNIEDTEVNGLPAKRVTSAFLDAGDSSDVIVQLENGTFVSLYGIYLPEGESSVTINQEINIMQMSFERMEER